MDNFDKMPEYIQSLLNEYTDAYGERVNCMRTFEVVISDNMCRLVSITDIGDITGEQEEHSVFAAYSWHDFAIRLRQLLNAVYNEY